MELWDAYDADGSLAGCDPVRGEPIQQIISFGKRGFGSAYRRIFS